MDRIGITLRDLSYSEAVLCSKLADTTDVDSVWIPESAGRDATTLLAGLSVSTRRVKLATGVINAYTRNPLQALMTACTIDEMSGGRFVLGLGSGNQLSIQSFGIPDPHRPILRVREFVEIFRQGLNLAKFSYSGKILSTPGFSQTSKRSDIKIPIYIAAHNPQMLRLAGSIADGVLLNVIAHTDIRHSLELVHRGEKHSGRDGKVDITSYVITSISNRRDEAVNAAKLVLASFCSSPVFRRRFHNLGSKSASKIESIYGAYVKAGVDAAMDLIDDELIHEFSIAGDIEDLVQGVKNFRNA